MRQSASSRATRQKRALHSDYFTLYTGFPSTKKQALKFAFGARTGTAVVRNKVKRMARATFWLNRHQLPVGIEIVMAAKKGIGALSRRSIRGQILDLFEQARRLSPPNFPETIELSDTSDGR